MINMSAASATDIQVCDVTMPQVGFGTAYFNTISQEEKINIIKKAIDFGYRFFDTAPIYGTEASIGRAVRDKTADGVIKREEVFITSKLPSYAHRPENIRKAIHKTLQDLNMDYVDLYLIHSPNAFEPTFEFDGDLVLERFFKKVATRQFTLFDNDILTIWKELEKGVDDGLIRNIGLSNFNNEQIQRIMDNCRIRPFNLQIESHPLFTNARLVEFCYKQGITVTAYAPFGGIKMEGRSFVKPLECEEIKAIARKHSKTLAQVLLRFQLQRKVGVIPLTSNVDRLKENISVFDFELDEDDMETILNMDKNMRAFKLEEFRNHREYPFNLPF